MVSAKLHTPDSSSSNARRFSRISIHFCEHFGNHRFVNLLLSLILQLIFHSRILEMFGSFRSETLKLRTHCRSIIHSMQLTLL